MKKITVQDIASELHLSRNTVTKALNGGAVSYETKLAILQKAQAMGYPKMSTQAKELLLKEKQRYVGQSIFVLMRHEESPFWNHILIGLGEELNQLGYRMQVRIVEAQDHDGSEAIKAMDVHTAGVVFLCIFSEIFVKNIVQTGIPVVFFDGPPRIEAYLQYGNIVLTEGKYAMYRLVSKQIRQKKQIAFIGDISYSKELSDRFEGYKMALEEANIPLQPEFLAISNRPGRFYCYEEVENALFDFPMMPEVCVCANDDIAKYVYLSIQNKQPETLKSVIITGFDNNIDRTIIGTSIPTVTIRKEEVGKRIARVLQDQIIEPEQSHTITTVATYLEEDHYLY
ncbi:MAG: LacI family transcriptional regulator [Clostridiales bacterium]|nr:LacI family transcriptional regulator [Clostridiales bacterium]